MILGDKSGFLHSLIMQSLSPQYAVCVLSQDFKMGLFKNLKWMQGGRKTNPGDHQTDTGEPFCS